MPNLKSCFRYGMWPGGGAETISGAGSTLEYTAKLRPQLSRLLEDLRVKTFLDAACGDFNWMQHVDLCGVSYVGCDIVGQIVAENTERYGCNGVSFHEKDITTEPLPQADLVLCRDVILHLPFANIADLFENLLRADFGHILVSSHVNENNRDLARPGGSRLVNLRVAPFDFPEPTAGKLPDWAPGHPERYLLLYTRGEFDVAAKAAVRSLRRWNPSRPARPWFSRRRRRNE